MVVTKDVYSLLGVWILQSRKSMLLIFLVYFVSLILTDGVYPRCFFPFLYCFFLEGEEALAEKHLLVWLWSHRCMTPPIRIQILVLYVYRVTA